MQKPRTAGFLHMYRSIISVAKERIASPHKTPKDTRVSVEIIVDFFRDLREEIQDYPLAKR